MFGAVLGLTGHVATGGRRDFSSASTVVAGRYDVLVPPELATQATAVVGRSVLPGAPTAAGPGR